MRVGLPVLVLLVLSSEPVSARTGMAAPHTQDPTPAKPPAAAPHAAPATPDAKESEISTGNAPGASTPVLREGETGRPATRRLTPEEIEARLHALRDKVALARANAPKPRPRAVAPKPISRPRFVVRWPEERVTLTWPSPEERFAVSWPR